MLGYSEYEWRSWGRSPGLLPSLANGVTGRLRLVPLGSFRSMRRRLFLNSSSPGVSARRVRPGLAAPDLRLMLATHSEVSGVLPDDIEDAVDGAVAELFGRADVLPVADPNAPPEPPE